jgi:hypothetical protein
MVCTNKITIYQLCTGIDNITMPNHVKNNLKIFVAEKQRKPKLI